MTEALHSYLPMVGRPITAGSAYGRAMLCVVGAVAAMLIAPPVPARSQEYRPVVPIEDARTPLAEARTPLAAELADFIELDYLGTGTENHVTSPTLFAPVIEYYGKGGVSRDEMMRDRLAYYARWPIRSYVVLPGTMRISERAATVVDVSFDYRFEVASARKQIGGIGRTDLTIRLDDDGGFTILKEDGKVLERF